MKKIVFFLIFFIPVLLLKAQVKSIYFKDNKRTANPNEATSYAVYGKLSTEDLWVFKKYDLDDNLLQTGAYKDEFLTVPHGKFIFYMRVVDFNHFNYTNYIIKGIVRFVAQTSNYVNGLEEGTTILFYPDGRVLNSQNYTAGKLNGAYKSFDRYGRLDVGGNFVNGNKDGEWIAEKGTKKEFYENNVLKSRVRIKKNKK